MMGTCKGCGKENAEVNDDGYCLECARDTQHGGTAPAAPAAPNVPPVSGQ